ncbi:MAG: Bax inhibitor-1/YccA family protein [Planctomycetes bacterium]|nr:Bax inhibitor-1/YccA family protein [Planctomycetota bacterium]
MSILQSSNPVLAEGRLAEALRCAPRSEGTVTVGGVVNKTTLCLAVAVVFGALGNAFAQANPSQLGIVNVAAFAVSLGVGFALFGRPSWAVFLAPIYAAVQGFFLGAVGLVLDNLLKARGISLTGGIALQAFVMTVGVAVTCLILYRSGAVRITQRGAFILWACVLGIGVTYLISFVLYLFGVQTPFIALPSQTGGSSGAYIGLGINALILVVAAFTLVADIQMVDQAAKEGAPASSEWYLAYGLTVSLVWIYFESMKIIFRLAMIFGGKRD